MPISSPRDHRRPLVAVVGPCAAGKSTLVERLRARGWNVREVAQEHSGVPDMWQRLTRPDLLICLEVSLEQARRRGHLAPTDHAWWTAQHERLAHAREHAHLVLQTDDLTPDEVAEHALALLKARFPGTRLPLLRV